MSNPSLVRRMPAEFCATPHLQRVGLKEISLCRSVDFNAEVALLLAVYVGDFKTAAPVEALPKTWVMMRSAVKMEAPEPYKLFLGCVHETSKEKMLSKDSVRKVTYNVEVYLKKGST